MANTSTPISADSPWPPVIDKAATRVPTLPGTRPAAWPLSRSRTLTFALVLLVALGGVFRCQGLNYGGFSEDETNKVLAVRAYQRGDWSANAEHPMVMKTLMWASSAAADAWNGAAARVGWSRVSPETALRMPNALAGALAVIPLFFLVRSFFGEAAGLWAACLLALDVTVTGLNRIGKEDTLLVLFLLAGAWLYEEGRSRHLRDKRPPHAWYAASGAAFGLMLASKYMPFYLGLWALFGIAASAEGRRARMSEWLEARRVGQRASAWFYAAGLAAFVLANPAILLPGTWRYLLGYVSGHTITHHGAYFAGRVYMNMVSATPFGLPWDFYVVYIVTKIPLPVLVAIVLGLAELVRRRRERGAVFARVFLLFYLLPASLVAGKFARYLLPTLVVLDIVAALGILRAFDLVSRASRPGLRALAAGVLAALLVGTPFAAQVDWSPYPSMHQNALGRRLSLPGEWFPNDELYDIGMREAVEWIARRAAPGGSIASDAPGVVSEYLRRYGRPDIESRSLSMAGLARPPVEAWLLAQNSHACFESLQVVEQVRRRQPADFVVRVRGAAAVETYRLPW